MLKHNLSFFAITTNNLLIFPVAKKALFCWNEILSLCMYILYTHIVYDDHITASTLILLMFNLIQMQFMSSNSAWAQSNNDHSFPFRDYIQFRCKGQTWTESHKWKVLKREITNSIFNLTHNVLNPDLNVKTI